MSLIVIFSVLRVIALRWFPGVFLENCAKPLCEALMHFSTDYPVAGELAGVIL